MSRPLQGRKEKFMKITYQILTAKYSYTTEIPYMVWQTIKTSIRNAVYWAKEGDYYTMLDAISRAETAINMYNNTLHYFKYDLEHDKYNNPIEYYELTGFARFADLIEAIYRKNRVPF